MAADSKKINELLKRGVAEVIGRAHLEERLKRGDKLRVKLGIDPTSPDIHLGNAVPLLKLRDFQELGHEVLLIIGDFTAEVGDTSDKDAERPKLSGAAVKQNMKTYLAQVRKILNMRKVKVRHNATWLRKLRYQEIVAQADEYSLSDFISRTNVKRRLDAGKRVSLRELYYPLMQGYDSVMAKADVEIGGTDQKFNLLVGRTMQEHYKQAPQDIITMDLIPGTDGTKMSKSKGNTINLADNPQDMYGKVMSVPDDVTETYFVHCTRVPMEQITRYKTQMAGDSSEARDVKMKLAFEIVKLFHGENAAKGAEKHFVAVFQKKEKPADIPEKSVSGVAIVDVLVGVGFAQSKSEARRLVRQGGVKVNGAVVMGEEATVPNGAVIQKGKRHFVRIKR